MVTPVSLYKLERVKADDFISKLITHYNWYIFTFYGELERRKQLLMKEMQVLSQKAQDRVAFISFFLKQDEAFQNYLWSEWNNHCPEGIDDKTKFDIKRIINDSNVNSNNETKCLERLFYNCLFLHEIILKNEA